MPTKDNMGVLGPNVGQNPVQSGTVSQVLNVPNPMVYYKSYGTPNGEYKPENRSATITEVIDAENGVVSLCVFNPTGLFFNQNVKQGQEGGQWDWMPYQKGQAKKNEELKTQLT